MWINSFAHGRTTYELKHHAAFIEAVLRRGAPKEADRDVGPDAADADLRLTKSNLCVNLCAARRREGPSAGRQDQGRATGACAETRRGRTAAPRRRTHRPRPQIAVPAADDEWLPQMAVLNDVLSKSTETEPPMRDIDGVMTLVRVRRDPTMHALTAFGANDAEPAESRLPAPEQPLLTRLDVAQLGELVERYIEYVDHEGRSVHLPGSFVAHYLTRYDHALPVVTAVATLPLVLLNVRLTGCGLNHERGIVPRTDALAAILHSQ